MNIDGGGWQMCYTTNGIVSDVLMPLFTLLSLFFFLFVCPHHFSRFFPLFLSRFSPWAAFCDQLANFNLYES